MCVLQITSRPQHIWMHRMRIERHSQPTSLSIFLFVLIVQHFCADTSSVWDAFELFFVQIFVFPSHCFFAQSNDSRFSAAEAKRNKLWYFSSDRLRLPICIRAQLFFVERDVCYRRSVLGCAMPNHTVIISFNGFFFLYRIGANFECALSTYEPIQTHTPKQ